MSFVALLRKFSEEDLLIAVCESLVICLENNEIFQSECIKGLTGNHDLEREPEL